MVATYNFGSVYVFILARSWMEFYRSVYINLYQSYGP